MRGVSVMTAEGPSKALEFLEKAAPPAGVCFAVIVTRILAVPLGNYLFILRLKNVIDYTFTYLFG